METLYAIIPLIIFATVLGYLVYSIVRYVKKNKH
ncbi:MAG: hypothetical protein PWR14_876 [Thermosediminibacterales bacterium]|jgi:heme/copper-type cytochrome/quinol oxidase subunit 2|nr:hypothetical protein [Thermosediminibacterales bacterium]